MLKFNRDTLNETALDIVNYVGVPSFLPKPEQSHLASDRCRELKAEAKTRQFAAVLPWTYRDKRSGMLVTTKLSDLEAEHLENLLITQIHLPPAYKIAIIAELRERWAQQGALDAGAALQICREQNQKLTQKAELAETNLQRAKGQYDEVKCRYANLANSAQGAIDKAAVEEERRQRIGRTAPMPDKELLTAQEAIYRAAAEEQPLDWTERHDKCPEKHLPSQITLHCGEEFNVTFTPAQLKSELVKAIGFDPFGTISVMREHFWSSNELVQSYSKSLIQAKKLAEEAVQKCETLLTQQAVDRQAADQDRALLVTARKVMSENDARIKELCASLVKHQEEYAALRQSFRRADIDIGVTTASVPNSAPKKKGLWRRFWDGEMG